jgi:hypothetical protein
MKGQWQPKMAFVLFGLQFIGSGCLLNKEGTRLPMSPELEKAFSQECSSLRAIGDVNGLNSRIDNDTAKILDLASASDPTSNLPAVQSLVQDISSSVDALKNLTSAQWTESEWQTEQDWDFGPNDLELLGSSCDVSEKQFTGYEVIQVYWDGFPHPELVEKVQAVIEPHSVHFSLALSQSPLSLCELLKVTGVQVRLNVNLCGQADWREYRLSLSNPK